MGMALSHPQRPLNLWVGDERCFLSFSYILRQVGLCIRVSLRWPRTEMPRFLIPHDRIR